MLTVSYELTFLKGRKTLEKKHYNFEEFNKIIDLLARGEPLPGKYKDHALSGNKKGYRDCHIDKNIVLIYYKSNNQLTLIDIGTHKEVLGK